MCPLEEHLSREQGTVELALSERSRLGFGQVPKLH